MILNIPCYANTVEEGANITRLESEPANARRKMQAYLEELGV